MASPEDIHIQKIHAERERNRPTDTSVDRNELEIQGNDSELEIQGNDSELEDALAMLSERIKHEEADVLLELIKNADEAQYPTDVKPKLMITYDAHFLRCDSNDSGFTAQNVSAICSIKRSTKLPKRQASYLDEKRLGFKSIFKIANVVWIKSQGYEFKLDKKNFLGMINPIPERFPSDQRNDDYTTQILVQVLDTEKARTCVEKGLNDLEQTILLFLKRLQVIEVNFSNPTLFLPLAYKKTFKRGESRVFDLDMVYLTTEDNSKDKAPGFSFPTSQTSDESFSVERSSAHYLTINHQIENMPHKGQRASNSTTEVILAFPVCEGRAAITGVKKFYSYHPIQESGLKFLVHADFEFTSYDKTFPLFSAWNDKIQRGIVDTFILGVETFNKSRLLRRAWPRYLPVPGQARVPFFSTFRPVVLEELQKLEILEARDGNLRRPMSLISVSPPFCDNAKKALIPCDTHRSYISSQYCINQILPLGVAAMDFSMFQGFLVSFVTDRRTDFRNKSSQWHECLTKVLCDYFPLISSAIMRLDLIPLRQNSWSLLGAKNIHFGITDKGIRIPDGLDMELIDEEAGNSAHRSRLYEKLGCCKLTTDEVADVIFTHQKAQIEQKTALCCSDHLLSQARFLFENGNRAQIAERLRGLLVPCTRLHGSAKGPVYKQSQDVFLSGEEALAFQKYFTKPGHDIHQLDPSWLTVYDNTRYKNWRNWLRDEVGIHSRPTLKSHNAPSRFSAALQMLLDDDPNRLALLLRDHWGDYKNDIKELRSNNRSLYERLINMKLECLDGKKQPLHCCYLARESLTNMVGPGSTISFARLEDPADSRWDNLQDLGLKIRPDVPFCIESLIRHKTNSTGSREQILSLYGTIQGHWLYPLETLRDQFRVNKLVAHPLSGNALLRWYSPEEVVWEGANILKHTPVLSLDVPHLSSLFQDKLLVDNASLDTLIREAKKATQAGTVLTHSQLEPLLLELERHINESNASEAFEQLRTLKLFHVDLPHTGELMEKESPLIVKNNLSLEDPWFIVDNEMVDDIFKGYVPTWSVSPERLNLYNSFMSHFGLRHRKLSVACEKKDRLEGGKQVHKRLTDFVRGKAPFILRIAPQSQFNRALSILTSLKVSVCERVVATRFVTYRSIEVSGKRRLSDMKFLWNTEQNTYKIWVLKQDAEELIRISWWRVADLLSATFKIEDEVERNLMRLVMSCSVPWKLQELLDENEIPVLTEKETARLKALRLEYVPSDSRSGSPDNPTAGNGQSPQRQISNLTHEKIERPVANADSQISNIDSQASSFTLLSSSNPQIKVEERATLFCSRESSGASSTSAQNTRPDWIKVSTPQSSPESQKASPLSQRHSQRDIQYDFGSPEQSSTADGTFDPLLRLSSHPKSRIFTDESGNQSGDQKGTENVRSRSSFSFHRSTSSLEPGDPLIRPSSAQGAVFTPPPSGSRSDAKAKPETDAPTPSLFAAVSRSTIESPTPRRGGSIFGVKR